MPKAPVAATKYIDEGLFPIVAGSVLIPTGLLIALILYDLVATALRPAAPQPISSTLTDAAADGDAEPVQDSFGAELSSWPAILEIQRELEMMPPEERRRLKLETGANWSPRTTTARPFDSQRQGYMFFQGPTPRTAVQDGMPSLFSLDNIRAMQVPRALPASVGAFAAALLLLAVLYK